MPTFTELPSGRWRAQVVVGGQRKGATFTKKADAKAWAATMESQSQLVKANGYAPPQPEATLAKLIERYLELYAKEPGKTKAATLKMVSESPLGKTRLRALSAMSFRDFVDRRAKAGAGGVTIAGDLSFIAAVLKWGREARRLDLPVNLPKEARASLQYRGLSTRSRERDREPTDAELARLYAHWEANPRQRIDMATVVRFALATAMRQDEICRIELEDVDAINRTVVIRDRKDPRAKAGNDQTVPLLPAAWAIVEPILRKRSVGKVFPYQAGSVSTAFTRAVAALGIEDLHFHDLRHRATADLFRQGLDIPRVALMTGHKTWAQLRRYTAIKPEDVHRAFEHRAANNVVPMPKRTRA